MDNSNSTLHERNSNSNGDGSAGAAYHHPDSTRTNTVTIASEIIDALNHGSAINIALQQHQALLTPGGQFPQQQDYANLLATAARSMSLVQGSNAVVGHSSVPRQAFCFHGSPALNLQGAVTVVPPASQGQPIQAPEQHPPVSIAGINPSLLAHHGHAGTGYLNQATSAPSPHHLMAACALLAQIGQASEQHQQYHQHPTIGQLQPADLGALRHSRLVAGIPSQSRPASANPQAVALGAETQGDVIAVLRALLGQHQESAAAPPLRYQLSQPAAASPLSSLPLEEASPAAAAGSTGTLTRAGSTPAGPKTGRTAHRQHHQDPLLSGRPPVSLHLDLDEQTLSDYQCLLRKHIELFETRPEDIQSGVQGRNTPIRVGQVGIRCRHCSSVCRSETGLGSNDTKFRVRRPSKGAIYYSRTLDGLYQVAQNLTKVHLCNSCPNIPSDVKARLSELQKVNKRTSGGKEYWVYGLKEFGVYEDKDMLRFRPLPPAPVAMAEGLQERQACQGPAALGRYCV
jgi:hypothetical protein